MQLLSSGFRIHFYGFLLFVFLVPINQLLSSVVLVVLVIGSVFAPGRMRMAVAVSKRSWDAILYMLVLAGGLIYSEDLDTGLRGVETSLGLVALPLVVHRARDFQRGHLRQVFIAFAGGLVAASLICLVHAFLRFRQGSGTEVFFFYQLTETIGSHPTYLAYYLIAALTFGIFLLYERSRMSRLAVLAVMFFLFGVLLLTGGITAFVSILYVFAFFLLRFLLGGNKREHVTAMVTVIIMVGSMFLFNELRNRDPSGFVMDDSWERIPLWESALNATQVSLFGVGTGDYRQVLNAYYQSHGMGSFAMANLNAHNQFLETYGANGLVGLAALLVILIRPIYLAVKVGNTLGALIFFPFLIYGMTEVFLGRYQGVVFFGLMSQCFLAYHYGQRPSYILKQA